MRNVWILVSALVAAMALVQVKASGVNFMQAMKASMRRMDRDIAAAPMNGNADHDFATMMVPHHRGAIEMAKAELSYGKDPVMRRLAEEILVDQQSEIDAMQLWLGKNSVNRERKKR